MNNHQLIKSLGRYPTHPIHRAPEGPKLNRWLTLTAQPPNIARIPWSQVRQIVLDALYDDWEDWQAETLIQNL